jgi:hypothetical protein
MIACAQVRGQLDPTDHAAVDEVIRHYYALADELSARSSPSESGRPGQLPVISRRQRTALPGTHHSHLPSCKPARDNPIVAQPGAGKTRTGSLGSAAGYVPLIATSTSPSTPSTTACCAPTTG